MNRLKSIFSLSGTSNPSYLTLLVQNKLSEGGPPKDGGIGSGNWKRHSNPIFDLIRKRDEEQKGKRGTQEPPPKLDFKKLSGWESMEHEPLATQQRIATSNLKILNTEVTNRLCSNFLGIETKPVDAMVAKDMEEFAKRFGKPEGEMTGIHAFCLTRTNPPLTVYKMATALTLSGTDKWESNKRGEEVGTLAHEVLHGLGRKPDGSPSNLMTVSNSINAIEKDYKATYKAYTMLKDIVKEGEKLPFDQTNQFIKREGMKYSKDQLDAVSRIEGQKSLPELLKKLEAIGIDPEDLKDKTSSSPYEHLERPTFVKLNKEEAVTELLARKFTKETLEDSPGFLKGAYQDECIVTLGNMIERHQGNRDSVLKELKDLRKGQSDEDVENWTYSLKYGVEGLSHQETYFHMMGSALKHGIITQQDYDDIPKPLTEEQIDARMETLRKSGVRLTKKQEKEGRETLRAKGFRRDTMVEEKFLRWFLKED